MTVVCNAAIFIMFLKIESKKESSGLYKNPIHIVNAFFPENNFDV